METVEEVAGIEHNGPLEHRAARVTIERRRVIVLVDATQQRLELACIALERSCPIEHDTVSVGNQQRVSAVAERAIKPRQRYAQVAACPLVDHFRPQQRRESIARVHGARRHDEAGQQRERFATLESDRTGNRVHSVRRT